MNNLPESPQGISKKLRKALENLYKQSNSDLIIIYAEVIPGP